MSKRLVFVVLVGLALTAPGLVVADSGSIHQEHSFEARPGATVLVDVSFHSVEVEARPGSTVDVVVDIEITEVCTGTIRRVAERVSFAVR